MKRLEKIMQREMTRKEFLGAVGLGIVSIIGFGSILRLIFGDSGADQHSSNRAYGSGAYGGARK